MSECVVWEAGRNNRGYGARWRGRGSTNLVHRQVMEEHLGRKLARTEVVRHVCDNPACYNLDHLRLGTQTDNMLDMAGKGRGYQQQKLVCPKCGGYYTVGLSPSDGRRRRCESCRKAARKASSDAYYRRNRERLLQLARARYVSR